MFVFYPMPFQVPAQLRGGGGFLWGTRQIGSAKAPDAIAKAAHSRAGKRPSLADGTSQKLVSTSPCSLLSAIGRDGDLGWAEGYAYRLLVGDLALGGHVGLLGHLHRLDVVVVVHGRHLGGCGGYRLARTRKEKEGGVETNLLLGVEKRKSVFLRGRLKVRKRGVTVSHDEAGGPFIYYTLHTGSPRAVSQSVTQSAGLKVASERCREGEGFEGM